MLSQYAPPPRLSGASASAAVLTQVAPAVTPLQAFKPEHMGTPPPNYWQPRLLNALEHWLRLFVSATHSAADTPSERQIFIIEACHLSAAVWRPVARELAKRLRQKHLPVQFLHCHEVPGNRLLGAWREQREQVLILVFGDSQMINSQQQQQAVLDLRYWTHLLWFELRDPHAWDANTWLLLHYGLRVYPAQVNSVLQACQDLLRQQPPRYTATQLAGLKQRRQPARLPARVERVLGDALPWAQACALLPPPVGLGFAESLRRAFFPQLPITCLERLCSLPELQRQGEGLYFSPRLLAILRTGFSRQPSEKQAAILAFLQRRVAAAEPSPRQALAHLEWQWYQARLLLDIAPDEALPQLAELVQQDVLKQRIISDLAQLSLLSHTQGQVLYNRIPLLRAPQSRQALQLLQQFAPECGIAPQRLHPLLHLTQRWRDTLHQVQRRAALAAVFSADGRWLAVGMADNSLVLWDSQCQTEYNLHHHDWFVLAENDSPHYWWKKFCQSPHCGQLLLSFSPDNQRLATSLQDNTVRIWDIGAQQQLYIFKNHNLPLRALLFAPDGKRLFGVAAQGQVWDVAQGQALYTLSGHQRLINHAALSPDGELLVTASASGNLRYWHSHSGEALRLTPAHEKAILHVAFSPDGAYLVSAAADKSAKVWEVATGRLLHECRGHFAAVNEAVFSPDGQWLITAAWDKKLCLWNMRNGRQHQVLTSPTAAPVRAQFSPDGQHILMLAADLSVQTYTTKNAD